MDAALFDDPIPASTPSFAEDGPPLGPPDDPHPLKLTKSISENESRLLQAVSNKYGVGAISAVLAVIILLTLSPSFVTDEEGKFSMQLIFVLSALVFVATVWGPSIWAWVQKTWGQDTKLNLVPPKTA
jgi:Kef-type K+ transport system membrane component KefB